MIKSASNRYRSASPAVVCQRIAELALQTSSEPGNSDGASEAIADTNAPFELGEITLRPHQRDAVTRIQSSMREFGGALLADTVGLGKTYVALAVARQYSFAHVLAPAALLPMWRDAVRATGLTNVSIHSLHRLSRDKLDIPTHEHNSLIIVDEAHHLRTRNTIRYRNAIAATSGRDVLLLSATPVHNRTAELRNLLALFLGNRIDALDTATLSRCIIRRSAQSADAPRIPTVVEHEPLRLPDNHPVLEHLLTLPPPLPTRDGAAAGALVRLGLLRAWCSSDAALNDSIRRRQLRGEALLHSLTHGRHPTQRELQTFILGTDSLQLGFPELLIASSSDDNEAMLKTLLAHLDGLQSLLQLHTRTSIADARRVELLRSLVGTETLTADFSRSPHANTEGQNHDAVRPPAIVAFSQFASTVRALHRALSDLAGVASLTSDGGRIASGPISRHELIANFAPRAHGRPPPPLHARVQLLLTTDLLAEGVNLQDAGIVVHLDLPWTDALRQQRVGRLARMGASHDVIHVHTIEPPTGAEKILRIMAALERKAGLHGRMIGRDRGNSAFSNPDPVSAPEIATQLRSRLQHWRAFVPETASLHSESRDLGQAIEPLVAQIKARNSGWLCAVRDGDEIVIVASDFTDGDQSTERDHLAHISADLPDVYRAVNAVAVASLTDSHQTRPTTNDALVDEILDQLDRWLDTRALLTLAGPGARTLSAVHKRACDALLSGFESTNPVSRSTHAQRVSVIQSRILQTRGAGAELALKGWAASAKELSFSDWLKAFPENASEGRLKTAGETSQDSRRVLALLIMRAADDSPPPPD